MTNGIDWLVWKNVQALYSNRMNINELIFLTPEKLIAMVWRSLSIDSQKGSAGLENRSKNHFRVNKYRPSIARDGLLFSLFGKGITWRRLPFYTSETHVIKMPVKFLQLYEEIFSLKKLLWVKIYCSVYWFLFVIFPKAPKRRDLSDFYYINLGDLKGGNFFETRFNGRRFKNLC